MPKLVLRTTRNTAYRLLVIPVGTIIIFSLVAYLFASTKFCYSVLLGGLCWFLPNAYMAFKLFHKIETNAQRFVWIFYRTELVKLVLIAVLFLALVKFLPVALSGLLIGFLIAQLVFWLVCIFNFDN